MKRRFFAVLLLQGLLVPALGCGDDKPSTATDVGGAQGVDAGPRDAGLGAPLGDSSTRAPGLDATVASPAADASADRNPADAGQDATLDAAVDAKIDTTPDTTPDAALPAPAPADASTPADAAALACVNDRYEPNDTAATSTKLALAADGTASLEATSFPDDHDVYEIVTPKHDPVRLTGSYTPPSTSKADLYIYFNGGAGYLGANSTVRTGATETWDSWFGPDTAGGPVRADVWQNIVGGCVPYELKLDTNACTDAFEDNDTQDTAQELPIGLVHQVTIMSQDDDYYDVGALGHSGVCTLHYSVPNGSTQQLNAWLRDSTGLVVLTQGDIVADGEQRTVTVAWNNAAYAAGVLQLIPRARECTAYTIECVAQ